MDVQSDKLLERANDLSMKQHQRFRDSGKKTEKEFFQDVKESQELKKIRTMRHFAHLMRTDDL